MKIKQHRKPDNVVQARIFVDAKRVSNQLNIEHKILYYQHKFKEAVIDNFVESYLKGETPIPCIQCNQTVKFRDLYSVARELKADALITGHYVKTIYDNGQYDKSLEKFKIATEIKIRTHGENHPDLSSI